MKANIFKKVTHSNVLVHTGKGRNEKKKQNKPSTLTNSILQDSN